MLSLFGKFIHTSKLHEGNGFYFVFQLATLERNSSLNGKGWLAVMSRVLSRAESSDLIVLSSLPGPWAFILSFCAILPRALLQMVFSLLRNDLMRSCKWNIWICSEMTINLHFCEPTAHAVCLHDGTLPHFPFWCGIGRDGKVPERLVPVKVL